VKKIIDKIIQISHASYAIQLDKWKNTDYMLHCFAEVDHFLLMKVSDW
jgi:hypothetical protein